MINACFYLEKLPATLDTIYIRFVLIWLHCPFSAKTTVAGSVTRLILTL